MDISVIIINYNTAELVKKCIESVLMQRDVDFEIIVVDNDSRDESVAVLKEFGTQIKLIANDDNKGFGKANNQALQICQSRYLFLLNPDAVFITDMDLHHAVRYMDNHSEYGLVGTRIINSQHQVETTAWKHYPREKQTQANFSELPGKWATVLGASMIVRRDAFEKVRGFDEDYFLYAEETDLCLRLRKQGYAIGYYKGVTVKHVGGASEKSNPRAEVVRKKKAGKYLFYSKHYPQADVIKIVKSDLRKSKWQEFLLYLKKITIGLNTRDTARYGRHQVTRELAEKFLQDLGG